MKQYPYKKIIPFIVSLAMFMEAMDTTIINTAIPAMAHSLKVNPVDLKIALISYLLSLAVFIPISGWAADRFGVKRVFITALAVFTLSSFWCGFSHSLFELVVARTLQGLGGSMMLPVGRLILLRVFQRHELVVTMGRVVMYGALGVMMGPVLGGFITHYFNWHWIFWVNIPLGIFSMIMAISYVHQTEPEPVGPLDKLGFVLFGSGLAGLTFGISALGESNYSMHFSIETIMTSIVLLLIYVIHSRGVKHPIVKTELFLSRTFQISVLGNLISRVGFGGVPFLLPLLLQVGFGYSPQLSGLLLAPIAIGVILVKTLVLPILRIFHYKRLLILNTMMIGVFMWTFMFVQQGTPIYFIALLTFIYGFLISLQYSSMNSLAYADISHHNLSAATSVMGTIQQLAQSFGVAVCALCIRYFSPDLHLSVPIFQQTFFALGVMTFCSSIIFLRLQSGDGEQMLKKPDPAVTES